MSFFLKRILARSFVRGFCLAMLVRTLVMWMEVPRPFTMEYQEEHTEAVQGSYKNTANNHEIRVTGTSDR